MSTKEFLKQEAKIEKEKLKNMSFQDKIWYIWEYYKFHIFGIIMVFVLLYVIGSSIYRSSFDTSLYCMYINIHTDQELNTDILTKDFHEYMGFTDKQLINTESTFISYGDASTEYSYASMAKISALVASSELDIMFCDRENFDHYAQLSGFLDLSQTLPEDLLALVEDRFIYANDESGVSRPYGIDLSGTRFAADSHMVTEPAIFSIVSNSKHIENDIALLRYIFSL